MSLEQLLEDGVIDEVLSRLKSGKEADVWLVRHRDDVLCAKVYKDRNFRSFKNNSGYKEGRTVRNSRTQRAMDKGSRFGQAAAEDAWKAAESDALHRLHAEGVRVPAPVLFYEGILLMQMVLDPDGHPAPRLIEAQLTPEEAQAVYADLRAQAVKMLCCDLIHGDLSPYNVLLGAEGPTIIDFPQVVSAAHNSTAEGFFTRDVENLRKHFAGFAPELLARTGDAAEIWRAYVRRELSPDFVPSGRPLPVPQERKPHRAPQQAQGLPRPGAPHGQAQGGGQHRKPQHARPAQQGQHARPAQHEQHARPGAPNERLPQHPQHGQQPPRHGQQGRREQQPPRPVEQHAHKEQRPRHDQPPRGDHPPRHDQPRRAEHAPRQDQHARRDHPPRQDQHARGQQPPRHDQPPRAQHPARPDQRPRHQPRHAQRRPVPQEKLPPQLARPPRPPDPRAQPRPGQEQPERDAAAKKLPTPPS